MTVRYPILYPTTTSVHESRLKWSRGGSTAVAVSLVLGLVLLEVLLVQWTPATPGDRPEPQYAAPIQSLSMRPRSWLAMKFDTALLDPQKSDPRQIT